MKLLCCAEEGCDGCAKRPRYRSRGDEPCEGSLILAARKAPLPGMGAWATTLPSRETAWDMPELASRKMGRPYPRDRRAGLQLRASSE